MDETTILIAPTGVTGALRGLVERLGQAGFETTVVDDLPAAIEISDNHHLLPVVLLDLRDASGGELEDAKVASETIRKVVAALPESLPVIVVEGATSMLVIACVRAGAADVIDLSLEGTATARSVIQRVHARQRARLTERDVINDQRQMIEELLKDLIRTERRTLDAEDALAAHQRHRWSGEIPVAEIRPPAVLLVESEHEVADALADRLEAEGVATFAYVAGEEAVDEAKTLAATTGLDLALVAAQLPGIDGLEAIRRLREEIPGMPAFLVTSVVDTDLAAAAADLGVVGFVQKPLANLDDLVDRLAQLARESLGRTREQAYLLRIKARHERVLARYRQLPRDG